MNTLIWYIENILRHVVQMVPVMTVTLFLWAVMRPVRLRRLTLSGRHSPRRREAALLLYVLFCAGLCALTIFPYGFWEEVIRMILEPGYHPEISFPPLKDSLSVLHNLPQSITPFREILRVNHGGPWLWFVLWGNICMFAPIGFGLPLLFRKIAWYHAIMFGGAFSFIIEFIQIFAGRVSDVDDLILNTAGTLFGFTLYHIVCKVIPLQWDSFHCQKKEAV